MLDLTTPYGKPQVLLASAATAATVYYLLSSLKKEKDTGYKKIPMPGSRLPYFGKRRKTSVV
jgi:hypothetical protein